MMKSRVLSLLRKNMNAVRDRNTQENERGDGLARLGLEISRIK